MIVSRRIGVAVVACLAVAGAVVLVVMLATGYVPIEGTRGVPAEHTRYFSTIAGFLSGLIVATAFITTPSDKGSP